MLAKQVLPSSAPAPVYRQELEYLYARRSAIDSLIESLEDYDRFQALRMRETRQAGWQHSLPKWSY